MSETETNTITDDHRRRERVSIEVNDHPVMLGDPHQTGASIKTVAIAQGVPIQPDFDLSEVLPDGKQKPIPNDKKIEVDDGDKFWAIPGDDNS